MMNNGAELKKLDMNELEQINGGLTLCMVIGFNFGKKTTCTGYGSSTDKKDTGGGVMICQYFGFGAGMTDEGVYD